MTDKKLDQILNQALAPEIADTEIAVKKARRNYHMNRIVKIGVSAVACAALIIVGNATAGHYMTHTNQTEQGEVTVEENPFVICAQAAELTRATAVVTQARATTMEKRTMPAFPIRFRTMETTRKVRSTDRLKNREVVTPR